jgi:uncharacterized membrane protein YfcA
MAIMIIGSLLALASLFLTQSSNSLLIYLGIFLLILDLYIIKKGREKIAADGVKQ